MNFMNKKIVFKGTTAHGTYFPNKENDECFDVKDKMFHLPSESKSFGLIYFKWAFYCKSDNYA